MVAWLQLHPRPAIYLRQLDLPGVDSKFLEAHRQVLGELLDLALPGADTDQDLTLRHDSFARLRLPVKQVFITENEINFLAFPRRRNSMVIFGAGYGFEHWGQATWLQ